MDKTLYTLKLGERTKLDLWDVWRVPGGWIFSMDCGDYGLSQFVGFNNEFMSNHA